MFVNGHVLGSPAGTADNRTDPMPFREDTLPLQNYDRQNAGAIAAKLSALTQRELREIREYERARENRRVVLDRIDELTSDEPWEGYDEQDGAAIAVAVAAADPETVRFVLDYEREHRSRAQVMRAAAGRR
jgi:hypothetical protein